MVKSSMNQNELGAAVDGPGDSEGGRSPSTLSPGQGTPAAKDGAALGPLAPGQRWSVARKREVALRLLRGESAELLSRELGVPTYKLEQWRRKAEAGLEAALKGSGHCPERGGSGRRPARRSPAADRGTQHGERAAAGQDGAPRPFGPREIAVMADATSPATGRRYGAARVCRAWKVPRSSFYAERQAAKDSDGPAASPARRGPEPAVSDADLLAAIRADLARSPWSRTGPGRDPRRRTRGTSPPRRRT